MGRKVISKHERAFRKAVGELEDFAPVEEIDDTNTRYTAYPVFVLSNLLTERTATKCNGWLYSRLSPSPGQDTFPVFFRKIPKPKKKPSKPKKAKSAELKHVTDYWHKYYCADGCTLCGNSGRIDSRGVRTASGILVGRVHYCFCPNGQTLRRLGIGNADFPHKEK